MFFGVHGGHRKEANNMYVKIDGPTAIISVEGKIVVDIIRPIYEEVSSAVNNSGCTKVCVDFSNTTYIDSSVIGLFRNVLNNLVKTNDDFNIINLKPGNRKVYSVLESNNYLRFVTKAA